MQQPTHKPLHFHHLLTRSEWSCNTLNHTHEPSLTENWKSVNHCLIRPTSQEMVQLQNDVRGHLENWPCISQTGLSWDWLPGPQDNQIILTSVATVVKLLYSCMNGMQPETTHVSFMYNSVPSREPVSEINIPCDVCLTLSYAKTKATWKSFPAQSSQIPRTALFCLKLYPLLVLIAVLRQNMNLESYWHRETEVLREKPVQVPLCPPQIPHEPACDETQASPCERPVINRLSHIMALPEDYSSSE
jgi:hypothetical protein